MNIAELIKECALNAFDASIPCDVLVGVIESVEPLQVKCGEMVLTSDILLVAKSLLYKDCQVKFGVYENKIVLEEGLKKGDNVALLRQRGGEGYILFAKF